MKQKRTVLIIFGALAIVVFLYFLFSGGEKRFQWYESYRAGSNQPYGTLLIRNLLESYREGAFTMNNRKPLKDLLLEIEDYENTNYVFIGQNIFLDGESKAALVRFLNEGGNVFIASLVPPDDLLHSVYFKECGDSVALQNNRVDSVALNFFHEQLKKQGGFRYAFRFGSEDEKYSWNYFRENLFCDSTRSVVPLGFLGDEQVNFIRIAAGRGHLFLHSNPLVFTNYFLVQEEKMLYASMVFSHLDGKQIIWDEYSKIPLMGNDNPYNSPLYYIMQQPSLKYAWWLLLLTIVLYAIFAARRRQRIIPVIEPKTNTSLEFVKLISLLHYKNGNHLDVAHKKMKYFLYFVRSKYGIQAEKFKEEHIRRLAEKSRVRFSEVEVIFSQYYLIEERFRNNIEANRLVDLNDAINTFYKQCK